MEIHVKNPTEVEVQFSKSVIDSIVNLYEYHLRNTENKLAEKDKKINVLQRKIQNLTNKKN